MLRLNRSVPTRNSAVQRPRGRRAGTTSRIVFMPADQRLRADARARCLRSSASVAVAALLIRPRATTTGLPPARPTMIRRARSSSGTTPGAGGGGVGGGGTGGGGAGGGGPGGGGGGGGAPVTVTVAVM